MNKFSSKSKKKLNKQFLKEKNEKRIRDQQIKRNLLIAGTAGIGGLLGGIAGAPTNTKAANADPNALPKVKTATNGKTLVNAKKASIPTSESTSSSVNNSGSKSAKTSESINKNKSTSGLKANNGSENIQDYQHSQSAKSTKNKKSTKKDFFALADANKNQSSESQSISTSKNENPISQSQNDRSQNNQPTMPAFFNLAVEDDWGNTPDSLSETAFTVDDNQFSQSEPVSTTQTQKKRCKRCSR